MTYPGVISALTTLLYAYNGGATFTAANTAHGGYAVLDSANITGAAAVLRMDAPSLRADKFDGDRGSHGQRQHRHTIALDLFVGRGQSDDTTAYAAMTTLADSVADYLERYPRLNGAANVRRMEFEWISEPVILKDRPWLSQTITMQVWCSVTSSAVEVAG